MMHRDYLDSQIGKCGGQCRGHDGEDEGLCPACCEIFVQVQQEDERLAVNPELREALRKLKAACDRDKTGAYQRILDLPRRPRVLH